jgi:hypothetical protein
LRSDDIFVSPIHHLKIVGLRKALRKTDFAGLIKYEHRGHGVVWLGNKRDCGAACRVPGICRDRHFPQPRFGILLPWRRRAAAPDRSRSLHPHISGIIAIKAG